MKIVFIGIAVLLLLSLIVSFTPVSDKLPFLKTWKSRIFVAILSIAMLVGSIGWFKVPQQHLGLVTVNVGKNLPAGKVLAEPGTKGRQINTYGPGWHHSWKYPWFMNVHNQAFTEIKAGQFAVLIAKDGKQNKNIIAPKWSKEIDPIKMITNADYFLNNDGSRGIQHYKVMPGQYPINTYMFDVEMYNMSSVKSGKVLVYESKYGKNADFKKTSDDEILSVPLVPNRDYRGIVDKPFSPGLYAIHPYTEKPYAIDTTLQTFIYDGGYVKKSMDVDIDPEKDKLITLASKKPVVTPPNAHGAAFKAKTKDNFTVFIPLRVLGQIEPAQAPRFIGTFGNVDVLETKLIEPITKNSLLDIVINYTAQEVIVKRNEIGQKLSQILRDKTQKAGFRTKSVQIGEVDIPPIVLLPKKIAAASDELKKAMKRKQDAQDEVTKVRRKQATADQQAIIVAAEMKKKAAAETAEATKITAKAMKFKANQEADASFYKRKKAADAERYQKEQQAIGARKLIAQIGKSQVGNIMLQDKINEKIHLVKVPDSLTIIGGDASKANPAFATSTLLSNALKGQK